MIKKTKKLSYKKLLDLIETWNSLDIDVKFDSNNFDIELTDLSKKDSDKFNQFYQEYKIHKNRLAVMLRYLKQKRKNELTINK
jgi:hypothetical protein